MTAEHSPPYLPSPGEIKVRCWEIRESWEGKRQVEDDWDSWFGTYGPVEAHTPRRGWQVLGAGKYRRTRPKQGG